MLRIYRIKFYEALQEVFVDDKGNDINLLLIIVQLFSRESVKYQRWVALIRLGSKFIPHKVKNKIALGCTYTQKYMPFSPEAYQLSDKIGRGEGYNVFLLESQKENYQTMVLKTFRLSKWLCTQKLMDIIDVQKSQYDMVTLAYKDINGLIPTEHYIILQGPDKGIPVVGMLQVYEGGKIRDVFDDFSPDVLKYLLKANNILKQQFIGFVKTTRANPHLIENELDLIGKNNLAIIGENENIRLVLLDPHFRTSNLRSVAMRQKINKRIEYLEGLIKSL